MSCLDPQAKKIPSVVQGQDKVLTVGLNSVNSDGSVGDPIDLTGASEIKAILLNTDNTYLEKLLSTNGIVLSSAAGGKFQILLADTETALLAVSPVGGYSDIEVHFTIGGKTTILNLLGVVSIVARRYPAAP